MAVDTPKKRSRSKRIQEEVVEVPIQLGRPRKVAEAEVSQFKECSLPKNGERPKESKIT